MIFSKQRRESNAKLPITTNVLSASPNQCCYFNLQNENAGYSTIRTTLLHRNVKTDQLQEDSRGLQIRHIEIQLMTAYR